METYVRGTNTEAINDASEKTDNSIRGGAMAVGAEYKITDIRGFAPLHQDVNLGKVFKENALCFVTENDITHGMDMTGSTDMGDLSVIMPVVHPYAPGAIGKSHGKDYYVNNPELACVLCAKWQVAMLTILLKDGAKRAKQIVSEFEPMFKTKQEYFDYVDALSSSGDRITYTDGAAQIKL
jgi:metal-dependent amidase/aminoacylase/carboxypeptidase family protein